MVEIADFAQLQNMYIQGREFKRKTMEADELKRIQTKESEYIDLMSQGKDLDAIRSEDPDYSSRAAVSAGTKWNIMQQQQAKTTSAQQEATLKSILVKYEEANEYGKKAVAAMQRGDEEDVLTQAMDFFHKDIPDGRTMEKYQQDGKWYAKFLDQDGSVIQEGISAPQVLNEMATLIGTPGEGGRTNFIQAYQKAEQDRMMLNLLRAENPPVFIDEEGNELHQYATLDKNAQWQVYYRDPKTNENFTHEQVMAKDFRGLKGEMTKTMSLLAIDKTRAEIAKLQREATKLFAESKTTTGFDPESTEGKLAKDLMVLYNLPPEFAMEQAMKFIEDKDLAKNLNKLYAEAYDARDSEVQTLIKSKGSRTKGFTEGVVKYRSKGKEKVKKGRLGKTATIAEARAYKQKLLKKHSPEKADEIMKQRFKNVEIVD